MAESATQTDTTATRALWERWDLPTWRVDVVIYGSWAALLLLHEHVPWPIEALSAAHVLGWHCSLQHEAIHGWRSLPGRLRTAIVGPLIGGWWTFELYKSSHSKPHHNTHLTDPGEDTETQYHRHADWSGYKPAFRAVLLFNQTLFGRLTGGPSCGCAGWCWWRRTSSSAAISPPCRHGWASLRA